MLEITTFARKNYATGAKVALEFPEFARLFAPESLEWLPGTTPSKADLEQAKDLAPLWSPSIFTDNRRAARNVLGCSALVYDLDRQESQDGVPVEAVFTQLESIPSWCVHSTAKSPLLDGPDYAKLRVIIPLARPVDASTYRQLWYAVRDRLALPADESKVGPESAFFLPTVFEAHRARYIYRVQVGPALDPGAGSTGAGLATLDLNAASSSTISAQIERQLDRLLRVKVNKANALVESGTGLGAIHVRSGGQACSLEVAWGLARMALDQNKVLVEPVLDWDEAKHHFSRGWEWGVKVQQEENEAGATASGKIAYGSDLHVLRLLSQSDCMAVDLRRGLPIYKAACPWDSQKKIGDPVIAGDVFKVMAWLVAEHGINLSLSRAKQLFFDLAEDGETDVLRLYLEGLEKWSGTIETARSYLEHVLIDILGADDSPATRAISLRWHVGLAARQLTPGCKMDSAIVLVGSQGVGKSTYLRELFPERLQACCFSDCVPLDARDAAVAYSKFAVIEYGELAHMSRRSLEAIKQELSTREATVRTAYARTARMMPRTALVAGTTNDDEFLVDNENRRFWPVRVKQLALGRLRQERARIWSAAVYLFLAGEPFHLLAEESRALQPTHEVHTVEDPWDALLSDFLSSEPSTALLGPGTTLLPGQVSGGHWVFVRMADLGAALGLPTAMSVGDSRRIGRSLRRLGWVKVQLSDARRTRVWQRST